MNRSARPQDPLSPAGLRQGQRDQLDARVPRQNAGPISIPNGRPLETAENNQSRAARFEDEKKRIIESCFSKRDPDGVQVESYITHVRINEDAQYATSPPPPESDPSNKKSRVILVAVRRSGRVRVHKARENPTGSFSIGKTWNLDDLSSVQSYTNLIPRSKQEEQEKIWAGGTGFIVTLGKPYYWQVPTSKEKDFFIASLIKIYRKYTGGKMPELYGFATHEVESLTSVPSAQATPNPQGNASPAPPPLASPPPIPASSERRPQSPYSAKSPGSSISQEQNRTSQPQNDMVPPPRDPYRPIPPLEPTRSSAREVVSRQSRDGGSGQHSIDGSVSQTSAFDQTPPVPSYSNPTARISASPQSSQTSLPASERQKSGLANGTTMKSRLPFAESTRDTASIQSAGSRPSTAVSEQRSFDGRADVSAPQEEMPPPERLRPYMAKQEFTAVPKSGATSEAASQFATPAVSPSDLQDDISTIPPLTTSDQTSVRPPTREKDYFNQHSKVESQTLAPAQSTSIYATSPVPKPTTSIYASITEAAPTVSDMTLPTEADQSTPPVSDKPVPSVSDMPIPKKDEEHRPGLGPMIKKKSAKDIAGQFRKAAMAATAFQPRQGGGAARLRALQEKDKPSNEPDGITGVVPAPLFRGLSNDTLKSPGTPAAETPPDQPSTPLSIDQAPVPHIQRTTTQDSVVTPDATVQSQASPSKPVPEIVQEKAPKKEARSPSPEKARSRSPQRRKRQRQEAEIAKYCSSLGIDPKIFDGQGTEYNDLLTEFGWEGKLTGNRRIEDFEAEIKREIGRAQATGWLGHVEQQEGKVQELAKAFDRAIEECEELDGLFTLYSHELETLADDIEYIEAQSQGLQVQTANQKLLQNELQNLLRTLTIPSNELRSLRSSSLDSSGGIEQVERALALVYKAMITIDPDIRQNKIRQVTGANPDRSGVGVYADTEIGQMRAVREKKDEYKDEATMFIKRFNQHMLEVFKLVEQRNSEESTKTSTVSATSLDTAIYQYSRQELWMYNALMLFVREVNSYEWHTLISSYEMKIKSTYQDRFRDHVMSRRKLAHKPNGEELEALFTTQEKEKPEEGLASSAARKLTVRRGKTTKAGALKQNFGEKRDGKPEAWEIFGLVLQQHTKVIAEEQNFIVRFFHVNSQTNVDFAEIVAASRPDNRKLPNLAARQSYDPDRSMAKLVQGTVESIYSFWLGDMQSLLEWTLNLDQLQGVGVLAALEQCLATYEETNQEYITRTVRAVHDRLTGLFHKFVEEQIKAVEETKVKIKKRKGIISFMRTFPVFSSTVEHMIPTDMPANDSLEVRFIVNDAYSRILKAMWESLNFIAKDSPISGAGAVHSTAPTSGNPEDKEALNYQILLIENMNHYVEEVDTQQNIVLEEWADRAKHDMSLHLTQYTDAVIRRPLGKWLDFVESTEAMMKSNDASHGISGRPSHSRSAAKKILSAYDAKEIRKGIDTLKKRVEKHFGDFDEPTTTSKSLLLRVFDDCSYRYAQAHERMKNIIDKVYDGTLEIDWRKEEIAAMFNQR